MIKTLLVDMDEVLVDFVGHYCHYVYGITRRDLEKYWDPGTYTMETALSKYTGKEVTYEDFFKAIDNQTDFWENMPWLPWGKALIELLNSFKKDYNVDWHVVTSPMHCASSYLGKTLWLKREFGRTFTNFAITPHKELFAKDTVMLIDDKEDNINKFIECGGKALLFPAYHNLFKYNYNILSSRIVQNSILTNLSMFIGNKI